MPSAKIKFKRILLKLSGEGLCRTGGFGIDVEELDTMCEQIKEIHGLGVQICLVVGGGNFTRGASLSEMGIGRSHADYMGMLATVMNGLALQDRLERMQVPTRVMSAIPVQSVAEPYIKRRAERHLEKGRLVIFVSGTGNTHFTTDTAAAVRAVEMNADILMKATKVDGIYDADPKKHPKARRFKELTFHEVLVKGLKVMDPTAISMCMENNMPIYVFDLKTGGNLKRAVLGEDIGTIVRSEGSEPA